MCGVGFLALRKNTWSAPGRILTVVVISYGLLFKSLFVALELPNKKFIELFVLGPLSVDEYWFGSILLLIFYFIYVASMFFCGIAFRWRKVEISTTQNTHFSTRYSSVLVLVGLIGFFLFFYNHPGLLTGSSKNILAARDAKDYSGDGVLRSMIGFLYAIPFFMMANMQIGYKKKASQRLIALSVLLWMLFAFFSDQRGVLLFSFFSWIIYYNSVVRTIEKKYIYSCTVLAVILVVFKTASRLSSAVSVDTGLFGEIIGNYVGRNFVENGKALIIMSAADRDIPFMFGKTYLDAVLILIPRSFYPDKSIVNLDTFVGIKVFGVEVFGAGAVPPGLLAESYLNLGFIGMVIMAIFTGWLTAIFDWKFSRSGLKYKIFYAVNLVYFGISVVGSGVSSYITQTLINIITFSISWVLLIVNSKPEKKVTAF